jgi:hypothetical protein
VADLSLNVGPQSNFPQTSFNNVYQLIDNFTWVRGAQTFKFGGEGRAIIAAGDFLPPIRPPIPRSRIRAGLCAPAARRTSSVSTARRPPLLPLRRHVVGTRAWSGYVARNPNAQFIKGEAGAGIAVGLTQTGRGNVTTPGINNVNLAFFKNTPLWEGGSLRFGIQMMNAFNHPSFSIGNGGAIPDPNDTSANFLGYANPGSSQFLDKTIFSGGLGQTPFQRMIQFDLKLLF